MKTAEKLLAFSAEISEAISVSYKGGGTRYQGWLDAIQSRYGKFTGEFTGEFEFSAGGRPHFVLLFERCVFAGSYSSASTSRITHAANARGIGKRNHGRWKLDHANNLIAGSGLIIQPFPDEIVSIKGLMAHLMEDDGIKDGSKFDTDAGSKRPLQEDPGTMSDGEVGREGDVVKFNIQGGTEIGTIMSGPSSDGKFVVAFGNPNGAGNGSKAIPRQSMKLATMAEISSHSSSRRDGRPSSAETRISSHSEIVGIMSKDGWGRKNGVFTKTFVGKEVSVILLKNGLRNRVNLEDGSPIYDTVVKGDSISGTAPGLIFSVGTVAADVTIEPNRLQSLTVLTDFLQTLKANTNPIRSKEETDAFYGKPSVMTDTELDSAAKGLWLPGGSSQVSSTPALSSISSITQAVAKPDINSLFDELKSRYGRLGIGQCDFQVSLYQGELTVEHSITFRRNTRAGAFREFAADMNKANSFIRAVATEVESKGFKVDVVITDQRMAGLLDETAEMDGESAYSEYEQSIGSSVRISA
jgi:hypothetical protein